MISETLLSDKLDLSLQDLLQVGQPSISTGKVNKFVSFPLGHTNSTISMRFSSFSLRISELSHKFFSATMVQTVIAHAAPPICILNLLLSESTTSIFIAYQLLATYFLVTFLPITTPHIFPSLFISLLHVILMIILLSLVYPVSFCLDFTSQIICFIRLVATFHANHLLLVSLRLHDLCDGSFACLSVSSRRQGLLSFVIVMVVWWTC